jgi:hypothetical protein
LMRWKDSRTVSTSPETFSSSPSTPSSPRPDCARPRTRHGSRCAGRTRSGGARSLASGGRNGMSSVTTCMTVCGQAIPCSSRSVRTPRRAACPAAGSVRGAGARVRHRTGRVRARATRSSTASRSLYRSTRGRNSLTRSDAIRYSACCRRRSMLPSTIVVVGHRVHGSLLPGVTRQLTLESLWGSDRGGMDAPSCAGFTHRRMAAYAAPPHRARGAIGPYRARWRAPILRPWPPTSPDPGRHTSR